MNFDILGMKFKLAARKKYKVYQAVDGRFQTNNLAAGVPLRL